MAKKGKLKIKFLKDYAPRKKGEVKELDTKLAEFYLSNGIAELTDTSTKEKGGCEDCNKAEQVAKDLAAANDSLTKANEDLKTKESDLAAANDSLTKVNEDLKSAQEQLKTSEEALKRANSELKKASK